MAPISLFSQKHLLHPYYRAELLISRLAMHTCHSITRHRAWAQLCARPRSTSAIYELLPSAKVYSALHLPMFQWVVSIGGHSLCQFTLNEGYSAIGLGKFLIKKRE